MTKDGLGIILTAIIIVVILTVGAVVTGMTMLIVLMVISWLLLLFCCYFFRDPVRTIPIDNNVVLSPGDGKVIAIEETHEPLFFKKKVTKISIFLSVFNVHINRIPIDGQITFFDYLKGKFYPAFHKDASKDNEQTIIGVENERCKILFKQVAGIIARRIVCRVKEGQKVKKGDRFGMIKFGSRIDIFIDNTISPQIKMHDIVKGGETIIGMINEK